MVAIDYICSRSRINHVDVHIYVHVEVLAASVLFFGKALCLERMSTGGRPVNVGCVAGQWTLVCAVVRYVVFCRPRSTYIPRAVFFSLAPSANKQIVNHVVPTSRVAKYT